LSCGDQTLPKIHDDQPADQPFGHHLLNRSYTTEWDATLKSVLLDTHA
jgi:hypothetical protein